MKRSKQTQIQMQNAKKFETTGPTPIPPIQPVEMTIEEPKEDINVDEVLEESSLNKKKKNINLDDEKKDKKKKKKTYDIDDTVIRDITLTGDIHVRLISNVNGYFVDIRRYFKQYPTQKGIRILASKFAVAAEYLKKDLSELIPQQQK